MREAAAEVLGTMASNFHAVRQLPLPCSHSLFKVAMDGINVKKEQAAASTALAKMAPHIDALDTVIVKQLLKLLSLSSFSSKQHILAAFAHWQQENNRGGGFVTCARDSVLQSIGTLVGSNDSSRAPSPSRCNLLMPCFSILQGQHSEVYCRRRLPRLSGSPRLGSAQGCS